MIWIGLLIVRGAVIYDTERFKSNFEVIVGIHNSRMKLTQRRINADSLKILACMESISTCDISI